MQGCQESCTIERACRRLVDNMLKFWPCLWLVCAHHTTAAAAFHVSIKVSFLLVRDASAVGQGYAPFEFKRISC